MRMQIQKKNRPKTTKAYLTHIVLYLIFFPCQQFLIYTRIPLNKWNTNVQKEKNDFLSTCNTVFNLFFLQANGSCLTQNRELHILNIFDDTRYLHLLYTYWARWYKLKKGRVSYKLLDSTCPHLTHYHLLDATSF